MSMNNIQTIGQEKHPKGAKPNIQYGTAGFRTKSEILEHVMYRMGVLATIRSKVKKGNVIGVMITASHNPAPDNGVKLVDPAGEMLENSWEAIATNVANASDDELGNVLTKITTDLDLKEENDIKCQVFLGRDTRPSSEALAKAVLDGVNAAGGICKDYGIVSTPQLHYFVVCENTNGKYGEPTIDGYFKKLATAFKEFRKMRKNNDRYTNALNYDGANGVGSIAMKGLLAVINAEENDLMNLELFNGNVEKAELLNYNCGADFVKVQQKNPENIPLESTKRSVSVDGDADRIIYFYTDSSKQFRLLDGDRIATLIAGYLKEMLAESKIELNLGLVQTAYANGSSTKYITKELKVPVACVPTGVKHLHHEALNFDIGVYFEANGHGTVLYSDEAQDSINNAASAPGANENIKKLKLLMDMTNQCVGDALSDMLIVESILFAKGWSAQSWYEAYQDLPNRQLKVSVKDRTVIKTTDAERQCVEPKGLQDEINKIVAKFPEGRSFVRPSGTEDVVRVYAESTTRENTDQLAFEIGKMVHEMAGGVGAPPTKP